MKIKDFIFFASIIVNLILGYWIYDMTKNDSEVSKKLHQSIGREQILMEKDSSLSVSIDSLRIQNKKKDSLLDLKPMEIIRIKKFYYEKSDDIINLSYDSSLIYLSERLQGVEID